MGITATGTASSEVAIDPAPVGALANRVQQSMATLGDAIRQFRHSPHPFPLDFGNLKGDLEMFRSLLQFTDVTEDVGTVNHNHAEAAGQHLTECAKDFAGCDAANEAVLRQIVK